MLVANSCAWYGVVSTIVCSVMLRCMLKYVGGQWMWDVCSQCAVCVNDTGV